MSTYFRIAFKIAKKSTHKIHKHGCCVVKGGAVLNAAVNLAFKECGHAERRCLRPKRDYRGASLYIVRQSGGLSHPCEACMKAIVDSGIKKIYYVDANRNFACKKISYNELKLAV